MVVIVRDRVKAMIDAGATLAQVKAARVTADYDTQYGANTGPWTTEMFVEAVFNSLKASTPVADRRRPVVKIQAIQTAAENGAGIEPRIVDRSDAMNVRIVPAITAGVLAIAALVHSGGLTPAASAQTNPKEPGARARRGATPISRASGRVKANTACRSNGRRSSARGSS